MANQWLDTVITGTLQVSGTTTLTGTLAVNASGGITTNQTTFPLITGATAITLGAATGSLTIQNPSVIIGTTSYAGTLSIQLVAAAGQNRGIFFKSGSSIRWFAGVDNGAESGSQVGSSKVWLTYDDSGAYQDKAMGLDRFTTGSLNLFRHFTLADGKNIVAGTSTGSQVATAANQKLGFFGHTPVVQRAKASYSNWASVSNVVAALVDLGLFDAA